MSGESRPPSEGFLCVQSQAIACTVHTCITQLGAVHSTLCLDVRTKLSFFHCPCFCLPSVAFFLLALTPWACCCPWFFLLYVLNAPSSATSIYSRLFPESLRWLLATQHYRRSKVMMLRIAKKNQVDMTMEPSGVLIGEWVEVAGVGVSLIKRPLRGPRQQGSYDNA